MNKKYTNEEFYVGEHQQIDEFVIFRAEEYRGRELLENGKEEYEVEEIHEDVPVEEKYENKHQSNDNSDFVRKHMTSSISSTISSVGSAGVFVAAVAVGGGVILNEPIDYGQINALNYQVDYYMENNELVSDVVVHIENELLEGYSIVVNNSALNVEVLESSFKIKGLTLDKHEVLVEIIDKENEVVDNFYYNISTVHPMAYNNDLDFDYVTTYNSSSYNLYVSPILENEFNYRIDTIIKAYGQDNNVIETLTSKHDESVGYIEDIPFEVDSFELSGYMYDENNNMYELYDGIEFNASPTTVDYQVNVYDKELSLKINEQISSDVVLIVKYSDQTSEEFVIKKDDIKINEVMTLPLKQRDEKVEVTLKGEYILNNNNSQNKIKNTKGSISKEITNTLEVTPFNSEYGKFVMVNYDVNYGSKNGELNVENIVLNFNNQVLEGYKLSLYNVNTKEEIDITGLNTLELTNVLLDINNYLVKVIDKDNKVIDDIPLNIDARPTSDDYGSIFLANYEVSYKKLDGELAVDKIHINFDNQIIDGFKVKLVNALTNEEVDITGIKEIEVNGYGLSTNEEYRIVVYYGTSFIIDEMRMHIDTLPTNEDYGSISLANYDVNYKAVDGELVVDKVLINLDNQVLDGFKVKLVNTSTNEEVDVTGLNEITLQDVDLINDIEYKIVVYYGASSILEELPFDIDTLPTNEDYGSISLTDYEVSYKELNGELAVDKVLVNLNNQVLDGFKVKLVNALTNEEVDVTGLNEITLQDVSLTNNNEYKIVVYYDTASILEELPISIDTLPTSEDYGSISLVNYEVSYKELDGEVAVDTILVNLDNRVADGFKVKLVNTSTNNEIDIKDLSKVEVEDVSLLGNAQFKIVIYYDTSSIVEEIPININTNPSVQYSFDLELDYLITDNNGTYNLYVKPILDDLLETETLVYVLDEQGNIDSSYVTGNDMMENIPYDTNDFLFITRLEENGNIYNIGESRLLNINPKELGYEINVVQKEMTIIFDKEIAGDVTIDITFVRSGNTQNVVLDKETYLGRKDVVFTLNEVSEEIEVTLLGLFEIKDFVTPDSSLTFEGDKNLTYNIATVVTCDVGSELIISGIEHTPATAYNSGQTRVLLDGEYLQDDIIKVSVLDSTDTEIDVLDDLTSYHDLIFYDLVENEVLTFKVEVYDPTKTNLICENTYAHTLEVPSKYNDLDYSYTAVNPVDVYLTYNEDGTFNAYFYLEFENNSEYDLFLRINLSSIDEYIAKESRGEMIAFENLAPNSYSFTYQVMVREGSNVYSVSALTIPSGSIDYNVDEEGYMDYYFMPGIEETSVGSGQFTATLYEKPVGDLELNIELINGSEVVDDVVIVVPSEDITENEGYYYFTIDLSAYTFTSANVIATAKFEAENYYKDMILENLGSLKGTPQINGKQTYEFYREV